MDRPDDLTHLPHLPHMMQDNMCNYTKKQKTGPYMTGPTSADQSKENSSQNHSSYFEPSLDVSETTIGQQMISSPCYLFKTIRDIQSAKKTDEWSHVGYVFKDGQQIDDRFYCVHCINKHGFDKIGYKKLITNFSSTLTTGTIKNHLANQHQIIKNRMTNSGQNVNSIVPFNKMPSSKASSSNINKGRLTNVKASHNTEFNTDLGRFLMITNQSPAIAENPAFLGFFNKYLPQYKVPSRKTMRNYMKVVKEEQNQQQHQHLQQQQQQPPQQSHQQQPPQLSHPQQQHQSQQLQLQPQ